MNRERVTGLGSIAALQMLLQAEADPAAVDEAFTTPLEVALASGHAQPLHPTPF